MPLRLALAALALLAACRTTPDAPPAPVADPLLAWSPVDSLGARLPAGIRVFSAANDSLPLRAWLVRVAPAHRANVAVSPDVSDNRSATGDFAAPDSVCVAANAGYFTMNKTPAGHVGLLQIDGVLVEPATQAVTRDTVRYPTARAALGIRADGTFDIAWAASRGDTLFALEAPPAHAPGAPATLDLGSAARWAVEDVVGTGPMLVQGGQPRVTPNEEVFFGTSIPDVHPRTAAGYTTDGTLLLLVVDGRQDTSRGVSLDELARLMIEAGAVEALNLDGGGSSAIVAGGVLLNRPTGGTFQREVMSALVVNCEARR